MRVVSDQVGLDEVMRDPLVLGRMASRGGEEIVDQLLEPVMRDDHGESPCSAVAGSGHKSRHDVAMDVGKSHVAAAVEVRQERMVEAQQVQDRGVQIVDVDRFSTAA